MTGMAPIRPELSVAACAIFNTIGKSLSGVLAAALALDSAHLNTTFEPGLTQADRRCNCALKCFSPVLPTL